MGSLQQGPEGQSIGPFAHEGLAGFSATEERYTRRPVDAYLIHRFLLDSVPKFISSYHAANDGRFNLKHDDDKGDHILVDDDYNITGVIDWEWAYAASKAVAFNCPVFLLPGTDFFEGTLGLGEDELGLRKALDDHESLEWESWREYALHHDRDDDS
ncbi:conserved hypothetical protein [Histoplasma capsulatum H143]|uniref:Aminoglycoside phosphotransferase domain-containing protein n=1 Tax=Ajellomyces capsulatus (strain H143) TaxID=544712 RepID=C6H823_AJECH|nr:conserved hypothetical protein [Histoplasma capsulatum H143]